MGYGRIAVFDLFGTILKDASNEYRKGLDWLKREILSKGYSSDDVFRVAEQFRYTYMLNRTATYRESSMLKQLEIFKSEIGFRENFPIGDVEYGFWAASRVTQVQEGVAELLRWLKSNRYSIYIMSNTIFSAATIRKHLEMSNIAECLDGIYTSGDCGYRKPGHVFFNSVYSEIKKRGVIRKSDVVFIGNSLEKDILGAKKFGFTPVWLSTDASGFGEYLSGCVRINDFFECKQYLESNYINIASVSKQYSVADGIGNRIVVYMQGCDKHCCGCHNQTTWDFMGGRIYSIRELITKILSHMSRTARNVTISGGEPLSQPKPLLAFLEALKRAYINVCLYTGYDFDEVSDDIKSNIHYLKTGVYVRELRTVQKGFYGSSNQMFWEKGADEVWVQKT